MWHTTILAFSREFMLSHRFWQTNFQFSEIFVGEIVFVFRLHQYIAGWCPVGA